MTVVDYIKPALTAGPRSPSMAHDTPAMPLAEAHSGGFFVPAVQVNEAEGGLATLPYVRAASIVWSNNTRQGYALPSTLKPAGYLFSAFATRVLSASRRSVSVFLKKSGEDES